MSPHQPKDAASRPNDSGDRLTEGSVDPQSIEGLFLQALQKQDVTQRETFLAVACDDDEERRRRVTALLRAYDDAGSFLETPAAGPGSQDEISLGFLKSSDQPGCLGTIGQYEITDVIGRGGMGIVLRAIDPKLNRVVAVKVLIPELAANPNARRRFLREAQAAAAVSHPHIVTIHAVEESAVADADTAVPIPPYLVMECVVGESLQQKLERSGSLRLEEVLRISRQVAEGLAAAHRLGLIHRDIKPANILLENGVQRVKITDFGLARAINDVTVTRTGEVSGTPQYMSPEQATGGPIDHRGDLFSLGCVMYAMCTGHSPFRGDSLAHVIKRVTQDAPRSVAEQNQEVPVWLVEIIDCLLQKDPEKRFQDASALVAVLDQHLARIQQPASSGSHSQINRQAQALARPRLSEPNPEAPVSPRKPPVSVPSQTKPPTGKTHGESIHGRVGRFAILGGVFLIATPPLLIAAGPIIRDGDIMELGGLLGAAAIPVGILAIALGYVLRYVIDTNQTRHRRLRFYIPCLMALFVAFVAGTFQWHVERAHPERQGTERSAMEFPIPMDPQVTLVHPTPDVQDDEQLIGKSERESDQPAATEGAPTPKQRASDTIVWPVQPGKGERAGTLELDIRDDGLRVALVRKSTFGGHVAGSEQQVTKVGRTHLRLHPGDYHLAIRDRHFGWSDFADRKLTTTVENLGYQKLVIQRDLKQLDTVTAGRIPFRWNGEDAVTPHTFAQSAVLNSLLMALRSDSPELPNDHIVGIANEMIQRTQPSTNVVESVCQTIEDIFNPFPDCIVPGESSGTCRLAPILAGTLKLTQVDAGLSATIKPADEQSGVSPRNFNRYEGHPESEYRLPPGKYIVQIHDERAGWRKQIDGYFNNESLSDVTQVIELAHGQEQHLELRRNFQILADIDIDSIRLDDGCWEFVWQTKAVPVTGTFQFLAVDRKQARCFKRLLEAIVAGEPEVREEELESLVGQPIDALFPGWPQGGNLAIPIVRGKADGTWRLKPIYNGNAPY